MTYYSEQVAAYQRQMADAMSGKRLRDSIRQLQERSKIVNTLKPLQTRGDITAKKKIGKRVTGGLSTEIRTLLSSDGIFSMDYEHVLGVN